MKQLLLCITAVLLMCFIISQIHASKLTIGDKAPDFTLQDQNEIQYTLSDIPGKKALYFYPADDTPGCTKEACSIRDNFEILKQAGITIFGLSKGDIKSKKKFAHKYLLPFPLLAATQDILDAYGVSGNFWRLYLPKRYTFLINENGIIVAIIKNVDVKNHAQQIIDAFNKA